MLQVVKASAGAGKTYFLTKEYLTLAFKSPHYFKTILAVTFTNKAAEEMKVRILKELNILANNRKSDFEDHLIAEHQHITKENIAAFALLVQQELLHDYSRFEVKTIDSFMQSLIRAFSYEIGIHKSYDLVLDTNQVIEELMVALFEDALSNDVLYQWVISFIDQKIEKGLTYNILAEIAKFAQNLFKEDYQKLKINSEFLTPQQYEHIKRLLENEIKSFEVKMIEISEHARKFVEKNEAIELKNAKYVVTYLTEKICSKKPDYKPGVNANNYLIDSKWDEIKGDKARIKQYQSALQPLLKEAIAHYQQNKGVYFSAKAIINSLNQTIVMRQMDAYLPKFREMNNSLIISDLNLLLHQIQSQNEALYIYDKIGSRLNHILIDEFQDTSNFQWENFKPLIENSLAEAKKCLIVGDIKQAIYRFRAGDWKLLHFKIKEQFAQYIKSEVLEYNFRSNKNIIGFNNMIFSVLTQKIQNIANQKLDTFSISEEDRAFLNPFKTVLTDVYADVAQKLPKNNNTNNGRVRIKFNTKDEAKENIGEIIQSLLTEKEYAPGDIALLVRGNAEAETAANLLYQYMDANLNSVKYQIITSKSLLLKNSEAVNALVHCLHYANSGKDKISLIALYRNLQIIKNLPILDSDIANLSAGLESAYFSPEFLQILENSQQYTIYELSERIIFGLKLQTEYENAYLQTFLDYLHNFSFSKTGQFDEFKKWWEKNSSELSVQIPEKTNSVRILTVHKSKGLAFNVVIIPALEKFDSSSLAGKHIWVKNRWNKIDESVFNIEMKQELLDSYFAADYFIEQIQSDLDLINLIYVAFTRPVFELIVLSQISNSGNSLQNTLFDILSHPIGLSSPMSADFANAWNNEQKCFELGVDFKPVRHAKKEKSSEIYLDINGEKADWREHISFRSSINEFIIHSVQALHDKVAYGKLLHLIMAQIKYADDIEHVFQIFYHEKILSRQLMDELKPQIFRFVHLPEAADWFSRRWTVVNEQGIITQSGELRIPDRVMQNQKQMLVVDYKFAIPSEEHENQVREYIQILKNMQELPVDGFLYYPDLALIKKME